MTAINIDLPSLSFWKKALIAFVLGGLLAGALAPVHAIFILPLSLSGLLILERSCQNKWQSFFIGWWFGWGHFIAGLYWIGVAFTIDANAHAALIPVPTLILPACLALFFGLATVLTRILGVNGLIKILAFASIWTLLEYIRGILFSGFPWNLLGYAWGDILPIMQSVAFIGIYGLTFLTVLISALPSLLAEREIPRSRKNIYILGDCLLLLAVFGAGFIRLQTPPQGPIANSAVRIVQPNNDQQDKWKSETRFTHVLRLKKFSEQGGNPHRLLIWPETAVPFFMTTDDPIRGYLQQLVPKGGAIITGAPRKDPNARRYWNSVQALDENGAILGIYDKRHLLPYGEYLPLRPFLKASGISALIPALDAMSDFSFPDPGAKNVMSILDLPPFRTLICYEVTFPWEVRDTDHFEWILNVTNDAWFGNTSGPYQHFTISKTRAIEQGVSLIRSANKGVSAIVDGYGRVQQQLMPTQEGVLDGNIPSALENRTPYSRFGERIPLMICVISLVPALIRRFKHQTV